MARRTMSFSECSPATLSNATPLWQADSESTPEAPYMPYYSLIRLELSRALRLLPPRQAQAMRLKLSYAGITYADVGSAMGIDADTAAQYIIAACHKLDAMPDLGALTWCAERMGWRALLDLMAIRHAKKRGKGGKQTL